MFIWCAVVDGQISYGILTTVDGATARGILEARFHGRKVQKLEIKGVSSKTFDFDVVGGVNVS